MISKIVLFIFLIAVFEVHAVEKRPIKGPTLCQRFLKLWIVDYNYDKGIELRYKNAGSNEDFENWVVTEYERIGWDILLTGFTTGRQAHLQALGKRMRAYNFGLEARETYQNLEFYKW